MGTEAAGGVDVPVEEERARYSADSKPIPLLQRQLLIAPPPDGAVQHQALRVEAADAVALIPP